jgi:very-long-chain ceramide synthase
LVTCTLIFASYGYHQSRVGHLFLVIMDPSDVLLSGAKVLKYLGFQLLCDVAFGLFIAVWFVTRHIVYLMVCWSIYAHIPQEIRYGCYKGDITNLQGPMPVPNDWEHLVQPFKDPAGLVCWNDNLKWTFLGLLLMLHVLIELWFTQIIRVAYKVLSGQGAEDTRSDDEDETEEENEGEVTASQLEALPTEKQGLPMTNGTFIEKDVLSTDQHFSGSGRTSSTRRKKDGGGGHSSSVNLLAGSDRKELLGRIGCDKPSE